MEKTKQLDYITYFRGIAIFIIVAMHTMCWGRPNAPISLTNWYVLNGGTFLFVFIAGFLFQYLSNKFEWKTYYKKKLKNVFVPYFVILTPVVFWVTFISHNPSLPFANISKYLQIPSYYIFGFLLNPPVWFMGMIFFVFLFSPLLLKIRKNKILWYGLLLLSIIYTVCTPRFGCPLMFSHEVSLFAKYHIGFVFYTKHALIFLSSYIMGMFLCEYMESHKETIKTIARVSLVFASTILLSLYLLFVYRLHPTPLEWNIVRLLEIIFFLSLLILVENKIKKIAFLDKFLRLLASYSFGIFFIHNYFIFLLAMHCAYGYKPWLMDIAHSTLRAFLYSISLFTFSLVSSIVTIYFLVKILTKLGIKDTRMFIGVSNTNKNRVTVYRKL